MNLPTLSLTPLRPSKRDLSASRDLDIPALEVLAQTKLPCSAFSTSVVHSSRMKQKLTAHCQHCKQGMDQTQSCRRTKVPLGAKAPEPSFPGLLDWEPNGQQQQSYQYHHTRGTGDGEIQCAYTHAVRWGGRFACAAPEGVLTCGGARRVPLQHLVRRRAASPAVVGQKVLQLLFL